jgi:hypothetical protein
LIDLCGLVGALLIDPEGADAEIGELGDASMLPREIPFGALSEVSRAFGTEFAREVLRIEPGEWTGPVDSTYGRTSFSPSSAGRR